MRDREPWAPVGVADEVRRKTTPSFMSSTFHWLCRLAIIQEKILSTVCVPPLLVLLEPFLLLTLSLLQLRASCRPLLVARPESCVGDQVRLVDVAPLADRR